MGSASYSFLGFAIEFQLFRFARKLVLFYTHCKHPYCCSNWTVMRQYKKIKILLLPTSTTFFFYESTVYLSAYSIVYTDHIIHKYIHKCYLPFKTTSIYNYRANLSEAFFLLYLT